MVEKISPQARTVIIYSLLIYHNISQGGLSLPWKSVVGLTDHPDMTSAVYHRCKTTQQQQHT